MSKAISTSSSAETASTRAEVEFDVIVRHDRLCAELGVEKENAKARRFYQRLGYRVVDSVSDAYRYVRPDGAPIEIEQSKWVMRKQLTAG